MGFARVVVVLTSCFSTKAFDRGELVEGAFSPRDMTATIARTESTQTTPHHALIALRGFAGIACGRVVMTLTCALLTSVSASVAIENRV